MSYPSYEDYFKTVFVVWVPCLSLCPQQVWDWWCVTVCVSRLDGVWWSLKHHIMQVWLDSREGNPRRSDVQKVNIDFFVCVKVTNRVTMPQLCNLQYLTCSLFVSGLHTLLDVGHISQRVALGTTAIAGLSVWHASQRSAAVTVRHSISWRVY